MRRRLRRFLPIVMIALAVQILAPIGACWAASIAASDPLSAIPICHGGAGPLADQANGPSDQTGGHHAHDGACALCCAVHAGTSLDTPQTAVAEPYRPALRVVWHDAAPELRDARTGGHAQARGPPAIS